MGLITTEAKDLPTFTTNNTCLKCRRANGELKIRYCCGMKLWPINYCKFAVIGEHVHRICECCQAEWPEQLHDKITDQTTNKE